jgi:hypothetical protein
MGPIKIGRFLAASLMIRVMDGAPANDSKTPEDGEIMPFEKRLRTLLIASLV